MATLNLGRIKPVFRDAYAGGTAYVVDDIVTFGDETFICILASTGNATSNATYWKKLAAKGTDGTDVGTTITTQGDILFRDGSGLQRLAKGTTLQTLKMNAGATAPEWATVAAASADYVLLQEAAFTNVASCSIDGQFTSDYDTYLIIGQGLNGHSADTDMSISFRQSNVEITAASYDVQMMRAYGGSTLNASAPSGVAAPYRHLYLGNNSVASKKVQNNAFAMWLFDPLLAGASTKHVSYTWTGVSHTGSGIGIYSWAGSGELQDGGTTPVAISGVTIKAASNMSANRFALYGLK